MTERLVLNIPDVRQKLQSTKFRWLFRKWKQHLSRRYTFCICAGVNDIIRRCTHRLCADVRIPLFFCVCVNKFATLRQATEYVFTCMEGFLQKWVNRIATHTLCPQLSLYAYVQEYIQALNLLQYVRLCNICPLKKIKKRLQSPKQASNQDWMNKE